MEWRTEKVQHTAAKYINQGGKYKTPIVSIYRPNYATLEIELHLPKHEIKDFISGILRLVGVNEYIVTYELWVALYPDRIDPTEDIKSLPLDDRKLYLCVNTVSNNNKVLISMAKIDFLPEGRRVQPFEHSDAAIISWTFPTTW